MYTPVMSPYRDILNPELFIVQFVLPHGTQKEKALGTIPDFHLQLTELNGVNEKLGITNFDICHSLVIFGKIYNGLKVRGVQEQGGVFNIVYEENRGLIREPAIVLKEGKADCDEATGTAYLLAWESGVKNIVMVEMKWVDPKTNERTGHSFIVLMPKNKDEQLLIYDFTYHLTSRPPRPKGKMPKAFWSPAGDSWFVGRRSNI